MADEQKCPRCGSAGYVLAFFYGDKASETVICTNKSCGLPSCFWPEWQAMKDERRKIREVIYGRDMPQLDTEALVRDVDTVLSERIAAMNENAKLKTALEHLAKTVGLDARSIGDAWTIEDWYDDRIEAIEAPTLLEAIEKHMAAAKETRP